MRCSTSSGIPLVLSHVLRKNASCTIRPSLWRSMAQASQRRSMGGSGDNDKTFLGSLSDSLVEALRGGRSRFSKPKPPTGKNMPQGEFYPPQELRLTYPIMMDKIREKLLLSNRLEAEARTIDTETGRTDMVFRAQGYTLGVKQSTIAGAGRGLFFTRGSIKAGDIITMYPGTVYTINNILDIASNESLTEFGAPTEPMLPMFLYKNAYLLSEKAVLYEDGWRHVDLMVDGNPYGQSALRFLAERVHQPADRSWLELSHDAPENEEQLHEEMLLSERGVGKAVRKGVTYDELGGRSFLSVGHLINHSLDSHVRMIFVHLPPSFPQDLLSSVPSVNAKPERYRRWVIVAVALKDMMVDADKEMELFLNYGRNPTKIGWQGPTA